MSTGSLIANNQINVGINRFIYDENDRLIALDLRVDNDCVVVLNQYRQQTPLDIKTVDVFFLASYENVKLSIPPTFTDRFISIEVFPEGTPHSEIRNKRAFSIAESEMIAVQKAAINEDSIIQDPEESILDQVTGAIGSVQGNVTSNLKYLAYGAAAIGLIIYSKPILASFDMLTTKAKPRLNSASFGVKKQKRDSKGRFIK